MASQVRFSLVKFVSELKAKHNGKPSGKVAKNLNVFNQTEFYLPQFDDSKPKVRDVSRFRDDIRGLLAKEFRERPKQIEIPKTSREYRELSSISTPGRLQTVKFSNPLYSANPNTSTFQQGKKEELKSQGLFGKLKDRFLPGNKGKESSVPGGSRKSRKTRSSKPNKH